MTERAISIQDLSFRYSDGTLALDKVSLDVFAGESVALLGPNGGGKTTLLLHLNGVLKGGAGSVEIFGTNTRDGNLKEIRRRVGIVFQDPDDQLFMSTVFDDVAFGPINMRLERGVVREKVKMALGMVALSGYEDRCSHHLSFGEKKRVAFATVLSMDPEILVFDEPTANLDPKSRADLIAIVRKLNEKGMTIVIATHDVDAVADMAKKVYVMNKAIVAGGTAREIFSNVELLRENNLKVPETAHLFEVLRCFGYSCEELPLSIEEAIDHLTKTIERDGKHAHLHIHEHTHEQLAELLEGRHHHPPEEMR